MFVSQICWLSLISMDPKHFKYSRQKENRLKKGASWLFQMIIRVIVQNFLKALMFWWKVSDWVLDLRTFLVVVIIWGESPFFGSSLDTPFPLFKWGGGEIWGVLQKLTKVMGGCEIGRKTGMIDFLLSRVQGWC